jgi:hypothetical protein
MTSPSFKLSAAILSLTLFVCGNAFSQTDASEEKTSTGAPLLQFNTSGSPGPQTNKPLIFKVPTTEEELADRSNVDPVSSTDNQQAFKTYVGYPKQQLQLSYLPVSYGGKFSYGGTDFNYSTLSYTGLGLSYNFLMTPRFNLQAEMNTFEAATSSGRPGLIVVNESKATVLTTFVRGNYCYIGSNFYARLCPGFELGRDEYSTLAFVSSSQLELKTASELAYGINLQGSYPLVRDVVLQGTLGYVLGSGSGASGELTPKESTTTYLRSNINYPLREGRALSLGFEYRMKKTVTEGKKGTTVDKWESDIGQISAGVGYVWEFSSF